jgi:hypothetical protein
MREMKGTIRNGLKDTHSSSHITTKIGHRTMRKQEGLFEKALQIFFKEILPLPTKVHLPPVSLPFRHMTDY